MSCPNLVSVISDFYLVKIFNPTGFNPAEFLPRQLQFYIPHVRHFIYTIWRTHHMYRIHHHEFVSLKAEYLKNILPKRQYKLIIEILENAGVIEVHRQYIIGVKSYGYKIGERFRDVPFQRVQFSSNALAKKLTKTRNLKCKNLTAAGLILENHLVSLRIRMNDARKWVNDNITDLDQSSAIHDELDRWEDGEITCNIDRFGRFHSPVTRLKSELRRFLYFIGLENEFLSEIDISNSQPFFLSVMAKNYNGKYFNCQKPNLSIPNLYKSNLKTENHRGTGGLLLRGNIVSFLGETKDSFQRLASEGKVYDFLAEQTGETREQVKHFFMIMMFGNPNIRNWLTEEFETHFPNELDMIHDLNRQSPNQLAHTLQRTESNFILDTVVMELTKRFPNLPIVTIHDSLIVPHSMAQTVSETITELAKARYAVSPHLKHKELGK